jgi:hypothetical protein
VKKVEEKGREMKFLSPQLLPFIPFAYVNNGETHQSMVVEVGNSAALWLSGF